MLPTLAARHHLPLGLLARYVLAPALGQADVEGATRDDWGRYFGAIFRQVRGSLDGLGRHATTWTDAIATLTQRDGLARLTMLPWASSLSPLGLTRATRAVCPACLEAQRAVLVPAGGRVYEPLLWRLKPFEVCYDHARPVALETVCPTCGAESPILGTWSMPGQCAACGGWLGRVNEAATDAPAASDWQHFVWVELRALILAGQAVDRGAPALADVGRAVGFAIERAGLSLTHVATQTGYSLSAVSLWRAGRRRLSIDAALRVAFVSGSTAVDLLEGRVAKTRPEPESPDGEMPTRVRRHIDWPAIEVALTEASTAFPPPPLTAVIAPFGADRGEARRRFPRLSASVRDRHAAWAMRQREIKRASEVNLVREATRAIWAEGRHPGRDRVQRRLPAGVSMRGPHVRDAWKQGLRDLGLL